MDDVVIARHLENLDRRLANVEQILPGLATKADLDVLATKEELRVLATKADLDALATKEELRALATKADLDALAAKEELRALTLATKDEIRTLATKDEIRTIKDEIRTLATKEELCTEIDRLQRHIDIVGEALHSDIQLLAGHLVSVMPKGSGTSS